MTDASPTASGASAAELHAELVAVVLRADRTGVQVLAPGSPARLPSGPLRDDHESLQEGVRDFAVEQTGHRLGFVEQLYTFADLGRVGRVGRDDHDDHDDRDDRLISISYLGLTRHVGKADNWRAVYDLLPWEDRRRSDSRTTIDALVDALRPWEAAGTDDADERRTRMAHLFGIGTATWRPELALQRYELLWEAGLVGEARRRRADDDAPDYDPSAPTGEAMTWDHRRILATALSRLRAKLQYSPVVAELMPREFTLGQLQEVVESIVGQSVHKQNFRRAVQKDELVEPLDRMSHGTGGRPAQLHRFRDEALDERQQVGTKVPIHRSR